MTKAQELARRVIEQSLQRGVREFVLCPGSRNSPLIAEALRAPVKCWGHMDERSAGFFALGRCRALGSPVAVITTSGTAAFEMFPAVIEALYQRLPLLAITADRPKRFRGTGAPQAIEQAGMFCVYAVWNQDTDDEGPDLDGWDGWGPAHMNVCLEEPLLGEADGPNLAFPELDIPEKQIEVSASRRRRVASPDVILLGSLRPADRDEVRKFLMEVQRPILAEATSGLREDEDLAPWMLRDGELSLGGQKLRAVLRIGGVPSGRFWRDLEDRLEVQVYSVLASGFRGMARDTFQFERLDQLAVEPGSSVLNLAGSRRRAALLEDLLRAFPRSEPGWVRALSQAAGEGASVFLGNSLPVREWNLAAAHQSRGVECWANRGANGIDGNVSTWLGWSAGSSGESWGIFGDLTALYDLNALWVKSQMQPAKRRLVVINNGGGGIFRRLPGLANAGADLNKFVVAEHGLGFAPWAQMWGCEYQLWSSGDIRFEAPDTLICEVRPDAGETEAFWRAWDQVRTQAAE